MKKYLGIILRYNTYSIHYKVRHNVHQRVVALLNKSHDTTFKYALQINTDNRFLQILLKIRF